MEAKIWVNKTVNDDNIIVFNGDSIYRQRVKKENLSKILNDVEQGIFDKKFIGVPIKYIKQIEFQDHNSKIKILYSSDSEEQIKISNYELRLQIFDFLKLNSNPIEYKKQKLSLLSRIQKPLIALIVIIGIFFYVYSIIDGMNNGYIYEFRGRRPGLGAIVVGLAQLGLLNNLLIFTSLSLIAIYMIYKGYLKNDEIQYLKYR